MRVLVVGQYFWPENFRINEIAAALLRAGCSVDVLTGPPNYPDGQVYAGYSSLSLRVQDKDGVRIHRVPLVPRGKSSAVRLALNYLTFVLSACLLGPWLLRRRRCDVVLVYAPGPITQSLVGLWFGWLKRVPVVTWVQDLWPESLEATDFIRNARVLRLVARGVRWIYRRNDLLLVQSQSFVAPVRAMAGTTAVVYHPNPGELPAHAKPGEPPALRLNAGFNIVFAGNMGTVQALDTVLSAAEQTRADPDIWWVLIGSGSRSAWLQDEVSRRDLRRVVLPGRFPPEAMPAILAQASALLVSLVRSPIMSQTVPSKIQAYLAAGRPIIAALDGEGARVVAEAGAGLACPAENPAALSAAVLQLKKMTPDELGALGAAGRSYYRQHFDPEVLTHRLLEYLRGVARDPSGTTMHVE
ncbi:MAG TPA: glycosyltransferase family 4 protein [Steroidobacteraceae bacterium]|nr:glycosyltransferase family 4 protein [Steroidobacteraceae bacterium]